MVFDAGSWGHGFAHPIQVDPLAIVKKIYLSFYLGQASFSQNYLVSFTSLPRSV